MVEYGRMRRFKSLLPTVIRPDILPTENGMVISELDSVPGGIGFTGSLASQYTSQDIDVIGGGSGTKFRKRHEFTLVLISITVVNRKPRL